MPAIKSSSSRRPKRAPASAARNGAGKQDFKVRDLSLAEYGRKAIEIAEHEMPGLMSIRRRHAAGRPLAGGRIALLCRQDLAIIPQRLLYKGRQRLRGGGCSKG